MTTKLRILTTRDQVFFNLYAGSAMGLPVVNKATYVELEGEPFDIRNNAAFKQTLTKRLFTLGLDIQSNECGFQVYSTKTKHYYSHTSLSLDLALFHAASIAYHGYFFER